MNIASLFKRKNKSDETEHKAVENNSTMENMHPEDSVTPSETTAIPANWIPITDDGEFICSECGNKSAPETNTENGTVNADLQQVDQDLTQYPTKIIYGICPVCGMEFTFKKSEGKLYLEPSEMMK